MSGSLQNKFTFSRIQSPSSINTYNHCPRKYYYNYIKKLPTKPSIHLIRGKVTHSVLENFFKIKVHKLPEENFMFVLKVFINDVLKQCWGQSDGEFNKLPLTKPQLEFYFNETKDMVNNWHGRFLRKLAVEMKEHSFPSAFDRLTPKTEVHYESKQHGVHGYIDAVHEKDGEVVLMDYKTSKRAKISPEYRLQLAIYAMLYGEKHGMLPNKVAVDFLKHDEIHIDVDEELVAHARSESELIHINTQTTDKSVYPMKPGYLCRWSTGECDFFSNCFGNAGKPNRLRH